MRIRVFVLMVWLGTVLGTEVALGGSYTEPYDVVGATPGVPLGAAMSVAAGPLGWPADCIPGWGQCDTSIGYPDFDGDALAFNCGQPGYSGHQGTDIPLMSWATMDAGVGVLAAAEGDVQWVFDGKYDRCEPGNPHPDCQPPTNPDPVGGSSGYLVCTPQGNFCGTGTCCCHSCFGGGNVVVIRHFGIPGLFATSYQHLRNGSILVTAGQRVLRGQKIAEIGSAGNSTGPHLHFEPWGTGFYELADPWAGPCGPNYYDSLWSSSPPWGGAAPVPYNVTRTDDPSPDGCVPGDCSLREAVIAANTNTNAGTETILVPAGTYVLAIPGPDEDAAATGDLDIAGDVQIQGAGPATTIVDANGIDRVFHVPLDFGHEAPSVALSSLTIRGGGNVGYGGGIYNQMGHLAIANSTVSGNSAQTGGGIHNYALLTITHSTVSGNTASVDYGGGIYKDGVVRITNSTVSGNTAHLNGGGIYAEGAVNTSLTLTNSTVSGNHAWYGGGIDGEGGDISLTNCTVSGNTGMIGAGIRNVADVPMTMTNLTVSGNSALITGGGIFNANSAIASITNSTLSGNSGGEGGAIHNETDAIVALANTLIQGDCGGTTGLYASNGGNLESPGNTCYLTDPTDRWNIPDPKLGSLAQNGGPTETQFLLDSSPGIDAGLNVGCPATDQRGVRRPQGSTCDIGAYERSGLRHRTRFGTDSINELADDLGVFRNGMWFAAFSPDYTGVDLVKAFGSPAPGMDSPELGEFGCLREGGVPDAQTDLVVLRKPYSTWQVTLSSDWPSDPSLVMTFGTTAHKSISTRWLDTNGDGCSDIGVFRGGCFDVLRSPDYSTVGTHVCFGLGTDTPLASDLDGDGKAELILWRPASAHYSYRLSSEAYGSDHGADLGAGDYPLVGDLNGDGKTDLGSYKQATSTFRFSHSPDFSTVNLTKTHGIDGDIPIIADVNGDGASDIGLFRDAFARWWFLCSPTWTSTCLSTSFGVAGDIPIYGKPPGMP